MSFTSIPILDLALAQDPETKPQFLEDLRHALMEVGFLYLKNVGIPDELFQRVVREGKAFFDIPTEEKYCNLLYSGECEPRVGKSKRTGLTIFPRLRIEMKNAKSFLGYSQLSAEITAGKIDHREQIDLSTEHPLPSPDDPLHYNLLAPNQWPSEFALPGFRATFTEYMEPFSKYFDANQQHKLKIVKYPDLQELGITDPAIQGQGVGPHKDSMLSSYLLQASHHRGLQVQNVRGEWIDAPPVEGTLVVAIGQGLEALTQGVCVSTTHRVLSPAAGQGARFSIPFFQGVRGDAEFEDLETVGVGQVPEDIKEQRRAVLERNGGTRLDDVEFTFRKGGVAKTLGEATLRNRIKSHPDVGERWYPEILAAIRMEEARAAAAKEGNAKGVPATSAVVVPAH
ncbi:2OG-Fe(II) oxygenase [Colletotrichum higginsianum]|nr:2OG-Fe(II) oxygenase [Colletotrichum higginsianum]